jgi:hypothetical protein
MADQKHTPGPWAVDDVRVYAPAFDEKVLVTHQDGTVHEHGRGLVALVYGCGPLGARVGSGEANRRLIAAAPELLEVAKMVAGLRDFHPGVEIPLLRDGDIMRAVLAAIATAEGR